jgi:hypothetical protein
MVLGLYWGAWRLEPGWSSASCELVRPWLAACAHACACTQLAFVYVSMCARLVTVLHTRAFLRCCGTMLKECCN